MPLSGSQRGDDVLEQWTSRVSRKKGAYEMLNTRSAEGSGSGLAGESESERTPADFQIGRQGSAVQGRIAPPLPCFAPCTTPLAFWTCRSKERARRAGEIWLHPGKRDVRTSLQTQPAGRGTIKTPESRSAYSHGIYEMSPHQLMHGQEQIATAFFFAEACKGNGTGLATLFCQM